MTIFDLYVKCDNIMPGACFYLYDKSLNYIHKERPLYAGGYEELADNEDDLTDLEVSTFEIKDDGYAVHVRLVV